MPSIVGGYEKSDENDVKVVVEHCGKLNGQKKSNFKDLPPLYTVCAHTGTVLYHSQM